MMQKTAQTLKDSDNILILPHNNPDGDAIGSTRALFLALKSLGKSVRVEVSGDIDEDDCDSKIASTELRIIKQLTLEELFLHALAFMVDHPKRTWSDHVTKDIATARYGYAVVRGVDPVAKGKLGDILAFAKECKDSSEIEQVALARVDGKDILPDVWYGIDLQERQVGCFE